MKTKWNIDQYFLFELSKFLMLFLWLFNVLYFIFCIYLFINVQKYKWVVPSPGIEPGLPVCTVTVALTCVPLHQSTCLMIYLCTHLIWRKVRPFTHNVVDFLGGEHSGFDIFLTVCRHSLCFGYGLEGYNTCV